jgi:hypothetical protein
MIAAGIVIISAANPGHGRVDVAARADLTGQVGARVRFRCFPPGAWELERQG